MNLGENAIYEVKTSRCDRLEREKSELINYLTNCFLKRGVALPLVRLDQHLIVHIMLAEECETFIYNSHSLTESISDL